MEAGIILGALPSCFPSRNKRGHKKTRAALTQLGPVFLVIKPSGIAAREFNLTLNFASFWHDKWSPIRTG